MMKCPGCGAEVVEEAVFCHLCGVRTDLSRTDGPGQDYAVADSFNPGPEDEKNAAGRTPNGQTPNGKTSQPPAASHEANSAQSNAERLREAMGGDSGAVESDLWKGGYCTKAMMGNWLLGGFLSVCFLAVGIWAWNTFVWWGVLVALAALWLYLFFLLLRRRLGVHYRLSSQRFFHEKGILRHTTDLIEVIDMDDITFEQTLIDRMTGVGSIHIVSSDRSHPELTIGGIENVKEVAAKMHDARHAERLRRGLHIEQI